MQVLNHLPIVFPLLSARVILGPMIPLPKPRGFWDYALFALAMTGALTFLFWVEASDGIGWTDTALAFAVAVLCVFGIILARGAEKATWIAKPTAYAYLLVPLGAAGFMFGALYADASLLHSRDITSRRLELYMVLAILTTANILWSFLRRLRAGRRVS